MFTNNQSLRHSLEPSLKEKTSRDVGSFRGVHVHILRAIVLQAGREARIAYGCIKYVTLGTIRKAEKMLKLLDYSASCDVARLLLS